MPESRETNLYWLKAIENADSITDVLLASGMNFDIGVSPLLAAIYEKQKKFDKLVGAYDAIYRLNPDNLTGKAMKRVYKKARKKSRVQVDFLAKM